MKKVLIMLRWALLALISFPFSAKGDGPATPIIVSPQSSNGTVLHRDLSSVPILCMREGDCLEVIFLENLGSVSVEIENQTTGEYTQTVVNALAGSMLFPISGTAGLWTITFTLSSGGQYYGTFNI